MKLNIKALTLTAALVWAAAFFLTGIANLIWPNYGTVFLQMVASVYPGYDAQPSFVEVITGTIYALVDGAVCGLVFAWVYNLFLERARTT